MKESKTAVGDNNQLENCINNSDTNNNHHHYNNEHHQIIGSFSSLTSPPPMVSSMVPGLATVPETSTIDQRHLINYPNMPTIPQNSPLMSPRSTFLCQNDVIDEEEEMIFPISDLKDEVRFCSSN